MIAAVAFQDIAFPEKATMNYPDGINKAFVAWNAYSNQPSASTVTTSSLFTSSLNGVGRWGLAANGRLLGIPESSTTAIVWDTVTNTQLTSFTVTGAGNNRNVLYDGVTNNWIVCGSSNFIKVNADNYSQSAIAVPTNQGNNYACAATLNGKVYAAPLLSTGANTAVAIFDLVKNTATTSSFKIGANSKWGAVVTILGSIYFVGETGGTGNAISEYWPDLDSGSNFSTLAGSPGYGVTNLTDGRVFIPQLGGGTVYYMVDPYTKTITSGSKGTTGGLGTSIGLDGNVWSVSSDANVANPSTLFYFDPRTNTTVSLASTLTLPRPTSGGRGFQDMFTLSDGRLVICPGANNSGRLLYANTLQTQNNNVLANGGDGMANGIVFNGKNL